MGFKVDQIWKISQSRNVVYVVKPTHIAYSINCLTIGNGFQLQSHSSTLFDVHNSVERLNQEILRILSVSLVAFRIQNNKMKMIKMLILFDDTTLLCLKSERYLTLCVSESHYGLGTMNIFHSKQGLYKLMIAFSACLSIHQLFKNEFPSGGS